MADEREVLVEVKNLEVTYGSGRKAYKAVKNANFTIYKGETFGLVGESGSGKTTIGRAIMRILPTSGGEVFYKGQKINGKISHALDKQVIKEIQMIFQDPQSSLNERAKVSYIVGEGLMNVRPDLSAAERDEKSVRRCWMWACCPSLRPASPTSSRAASASASASPARWSWSRSSSSPTSPSRHWICPSAPRS